MPSLPNSHRYKSVSSKKDAYYRFFSRFNTKTPAKPRTLLTKVILKTALLSSFFNAGVAVLQGLMRRDNLLSKKIFQNIWFLLHGYYKIVIYLLFTFAVLHMIIKNQHANLINLFRGYIFAWVLIFLLCFTILFILVTSTSTKKSEKNKCNLKFANFTQLFVDVALPSVLLFGIIVSHILMGKFSLPIKISLQQQKMKKILKVSESTSNTTGSVYPSEDDVDHSWSSNNSSNADDSDVSIKSSSDIVIPKHLSYWLLLYGFFLAVFRIGFYYLNSLTYPINQNHFNLIKLLSGLFGFYYLLKFCLKRVARHIDKNIAVAKFSMEILTEFLSSCTYWYSMRLALSKISLDVTFGWYLVFIWGLDAVFWIFNNYVRFTTSYHRNFIQSQNEDEPNITQWKVRGAIDTSVNAITGIATIIPVSVEIFVSDQYKKYWKPYFTTFAPLLFHCIGWCLVIFKPGFAGTISDQRQINMAEPLMRMYNNNRPFFTFVVVVSLLLVYSPKISYLSFSCYQKRYLTNFIFFYGSLYCIGAVGSIAIVLGMIVYMLKNKMPIKKSKTSQLFESEQLGLKEEKVPKEHQLAITDDNLKNEEEVLNEPIFVEKEEEDGQNEHIFVEKEKQDAPDEPILVETEKEDAPDEPILVEKENQEVTNEHVVVEKPKEKILNQNVDSLQHEHSKKSIFECLENATTIDERKLTIIQDSCHLYHNEPHQEFDKALINSINKFIRNISKKLFSVDKEESTDNKLTALVLLGSSGAGKTYYLNCLWEMFNNLSELIQRKTKKQFVVLPILQSTVTKIASRNEIVPQQVMKHYQSEINNSKLKKTVKQNLFKFKRKKKKYYWLITIDELLFFPCLTPHEIIDEKKVNLMQQIFNEMQKKKKNFSNFVLYLNNNNNDKKKNDDNYFLLITSNYYENDIFEENNLKKLKENDSFAIHRIVSEDHTHLGENKYNLHTTLSKTFSNTVTYSQLQEIVVTHNNPFLFNFVEKSQFDAFHLFNQTTDYHEYLKDAPYKPQYLKSVENNRLINTFIVDLKKDLAKAKKHNVMACIFIEKEITECLFTSCIHILKFLLNMNCVVCIETNKQENWLETFMQSNIENYSFPSLDENTKSTQYLVNQDELDSIKNRFSRYSYNITFTTELKLSDQNKRKNILESQLSKKTFYRKWDPETNVFLDKIHN